MGHIPEKSGMDAVDCVPLVADATAGATTSPSWFDVLQSSSRCERTALD
jgi:hypothetical protein